MDTSDKSGKEFNPLWHELFSGELPALRRGRKMLRFLSPTAHARCRLCYAGFDGFSAPMLRALGRGPWLRNPNYCVKCESVLAEQRGGAEVEIAILYADVRGSTEMAARLGPTAFAGAMQDFFRLATGVFTRTDAIVDKMVGDEMIGLFVPALIGPDYRRCAVAAGLELLNATSRATNGPPVSIGVGVHSGTTFLGSIGVEGGNYQFAALGGSMNYGARLVAAAGPGELVMSETVWQSVAGEFAAERRQVPLKGYDELQNIYVVSTSPAK